MDFKNVDKIDWEFIGKIEPTQMCFGKLRRTRACPTCNDKTLLVFRNKGRFKLACPNCKYERIGKEVDFLHHTQFNELITTLGVEK